MQIGDTAIGFHTGDLTQLAQPDQFDPLDQVAKSIKTNQIFYVPGEHDVLNDNGKLLPFALWRE